MYLFLCIEHYCTSLFTHGLKYNFCMAFARIALVCPACIPLLVDIRRGHFLSMLFAVPGLHDGSSTDAHFTFKLLVLLLLHFDSRRSSARRIPNYTEYVRETLVFV